MDSLGALPDRNQCDAIITAVLPVATALYLLTSQEFLIARIRRRAISARTIYPASIAASTMTNMVVSSARHRRNVDYEIASANNPRTGTGRADARFIEIDWKSSPDGEDYAKRLDAELTARLDPAGRL